MKILIVEDNEERIKVFKWMFEEHELDITCNVDLALNYVRSTKYDCILLDHDLGGQNAGYLHHTHEKSGMHVAKAIPNTMNKSTYCIVHSWNPYSSVIMVNYLRENNVRVDKLVFGTFSKEILDNVL